MFRSPSSAGLPGIETMLDDLPATRRQIAQHLDIAESTLAAYRRTGNAPRSVMLALFWETRWGRSVADSEAHNFGMVHFHQAQAMQEHARRLAGIIWRLECEITKKGTDLAAGAYPANLPVFNVG